MNIIASRDPADDFWAKLAEGKKTEVVRMLDKKVEVPAFGNGYQGRHIYETTSFSVTAQGVSLKIPTEEEKKINTSAAWAQMYLGKPWADWSEVRLSQDRSHYIFPNGELLLKSTIRRVAQLTLPQEHLWLHKMFTIPNSQVKNFLNACRGLYGNEKPTMTIAVVGSKAREGTGLWHKLFAVYALARSTEVYLDFYDPAEIADYGVIEIGQKRVSCSWIAEKFDPKMTQEYDVVIDDAWVSGKSGLGVEIHAGSVKGQGDRLFLHLTEKRKFISKESNFLTSCPCILCQEIQKCVDSYEEYQVVRMYCTRLGHVTNCASAFYTNDLKAVAGFMNELMTKPRVDIRTNMMIRGLLSVMEEVPVAVDGVKVSKCQGIPTFSPLNRFFDKRVRAESKIVPFCQGKRVLFVGVQASILGDTQVLKVQSTNAQHKVAHTDIIFLANKALWAQTASAAPHVGGVPDVYVPVSPQEASSEFPDWEPTGFTHESYVGYRKVKTIAKEIRIGQLIGGVWHPPTRLLPVLDVTRLGYPLVDSDTFDQKTALWWRLKMGELVPEIDPTFSKDLKTLLLVDQQGSWRLAHAPGMRTGMLKFGSGSFGYYHSTDKLTKEENDLLTLLCKSQLRTITKSQFLQLQKAVPQVTIEAKESKKGRFSLSFYWSQEIVPKFVIDVMISLSQSPVTQAMSEFDGDLKTEWSRLIRLYGEDYFDGSTRGKKAAKVIQGKNFGVKKKT